MVHIQHYQFGVVFPSVNKSFIIFSWAPVYLSVIRLLNLLMIIVQYFVSMYLFLCCYLQYDRSEVPDVCEVYGTIECKVIGIAYYTLLK